MRRLGSRETSLRLQSSLAVSGLPTLASEFNKARCVAARLGHDFAYLCGFR